MIKQTEQQLNQLQSSKASHSQSRSNLVQSGNALSTSPGVDGIQNESKDKIRVLNDATEGQPDEQNRNSGLVSPSSNRIDAGSGLLNHDILAAKDSIVGNYKVPNSRLQPYQDIMN